MKKGEEMGRKEREKGSEVWGRPGSWRAYCVRMHPLQHHCLSIRGQVYTKICVCRRFHLCVPGVDGVSLCVWLPGGSLMF